ELVLGAGQFLPRFYLPDPDITAGIFARGQPLAIGVEVDNLDGTFYSRKRPEVLPGGRIPDLDCLVLASRCQERAIGTEGNGGNSIPVPGQIELFQARRKVPNANFLLRGRDQPPPIPAKHDPNGPAGIGCLQYSPVSIAGNLPQADQAKLRRGMGDNLAVRAERDSRSIGTANKPAALEVAGIIQDGS